jgi:NADH:ubiquinone oxidoreductase subunit C
MRYWATKSNILDSALGELTLTVAPVNYHGVAQTLRDDARLGFEQLIDLCGLDYSQYKDGAHSKFTDAPRFAVVSHLLSICAQLAFACAQLCGERRCARHCICQRHLEFR